jgi:hypothetical protein
MKKSFENKAESVDKKQIASDVLKKYIGGVKLLNP